MVYRKQKTNIIDQKAVKMFYLLRLVSSEIWNGNLLSSHIIIKVIDLRKCNGRLHIMLQHCHMCQKFWNIKGVLAGSLNKLRARIWINETTGKNKWILAAVWC